ncbi:MAG: sulfotransferase family 2 domain-containing protein [Pseudomonadota bacterium]
MNYPIIYIHIPKTAGTSFRISAAAYYGEDKVLYDYGADSDATSDALLNSEDLQHNIDKVREAGMRARMLGGHFSLPKYRDLFPESPVISFFRDPVDRVISEYVHFTNHHGYTGTLSDFYRSPRFQNRQHKSLGGAKPTDLDFYGLTERYPQSLEMFNAKYNTTLSLVTLNKGNYGNNNNRIEPTEQQRAEIRHLNQADVTLYQIAVDNFEQQSVTAHGSPSPLTRYKGNLGGVRQNKIYGWVFDNDSAKPTVLHVSVNGEKRLEAVADVERPDIVRSGLRTDARCGFIVSLKELGPLRDDDSISIQTADGNYELINSPLVYAV